MMECHAPTEQIHSDCCPEALGDDCDLACSLRCAAALTTPAVDFAAQPSTKIVISGGFAGQGAPEWSTAPPTPPPNFSQRPIKEFCFNQLVNGKYYESFFDHLGRRFGIDFVVGDGGCACRV